MARKQEVAQVPPPSVTERSSVRSALIFISHDSRDAALAEAFENLLTDASGGVLKAFRSSDRKGSSGIEFGAEWYATIMSKLGEATDVVALITPRSLGRPWILYEVGVARGKLNTPAFGVAFGVSLDQISGPFAQFQNSPDDEDSLTKLVLQLIRRNPDASPREEAVRRQVAAFRGQLGEIGTGVDANATRSPTEATDVAKLFEEVKAMFRELPSQVRDQLRRERLLSVATSSDDDWLRQGLRFLAKFEEADAGSRADRWSEFVSWLWERASDFDRPAYETFRALRGDADADLHAAHRALVDYARNFATRDELSRDARDVEYFVRRAADVVEAWTHAKDVQDVGAKPKRRQK